MGSKSPNISFRADKDTRKILSELKRDGVILSEFIRNAINEQYKRKELVPLYSITKEGKIWQHFGGQFEGWMKPILNKTGYHYVNFYGCGYGQKGWIHRLVALSFILNDRDKPMVHHINSIKTDNRSENLEWVNASENCQYREEFKKQTKEGIENGR